MSTRPAGECRDLDLVAALASLRDLHAAICNRQDLTGRQRDVLMATALATIGWSKSRARVSAQQLAKTAGVSPRKFYEHWSELAKLGLVGSSEDGGRCRGSMAARWIRFKSLGLPEPGMSAQSGQSNGAGMSAQSGQGTSAQSGAVCLPPQGQTPSISTDNLSRKAEPQPELAFPEPTPEERARESERDFNPEWLSAFDAAWAERNGGVPAGEYPQPAAARILNALYASHGAPIFSALLREFKNDGQVRTPTAFVFFQRLSAYTGPAVRRLKESARGPAPESKPAAPENRTPEPQPAQPLTPVNAAPATSPPLAHPEVQDLALAVDRAAAGKSAPPRLTREERLRAFQRWAASPEPVEAHHREE